MLEVVVEDETDAGTEAELLLSLPKMLLGDETAEETLTDVGPTFEELTLAVLLAAAEEATFDVEAAALAELALAVLLAAAEEATFDVEAAAFAELAFTVLLSAAGETLDVVGGAIDELTLAALDATEAAMFGELLGLAGPTLDEGLALDEVDATEETILEGLAEAKVEAEPFLDELATADGDEAATGLEIGLPIEDELS